MSKKTCDRLQAMREETPSLSEKVDEALEKIIGEKVEFYMIIMTDNDEGQMLVSTAGRMDTDKIERAPLIMLEALARVGEEGESRVRIRETDNKPH